MGLSVVHGILKSHGGVVTVESSPGKGAQFTVYLPVAEGAEGREAADACPAQGRKKILLVDDEEIILSSMKRAPERSSFSVAAARDGSEALALFEQEPDGFDLVITDLTMPGMNGLAVARKLMEIRASRPSRDPVHGILGHHRRGGGKGPEHPRAHPEARRHGRDQGGRLTGPGRVTHDPSR